MDITLIHILLFLLILSISYLAYAILKRNKINTSLPMNMSFEQMQKKMNNQEQEYIVMRVPESPVRPVVDELISAYDKELDEISDKLETFPSELTRNERQILQNRYDELIKLMVNRFGEKIEHIDFNDALTSLKKEKGDKHAN